MENNTLLGIKIIAIADCIFGIFVLGWLFKASSNFVIMINTFLSKCPCAIVPKIAFLVVLLLIVLFIKSGVQIFKLDPKGRDDHISFSSIGILILFFPAFFSHKQGGVSFAAMIYGLLIAYLAWSIFYLNGSKVKEQFK